MRPIVGRFAALVVSAATMTMLSGGLPLAAQEPGTTQAETKTKTKSAKRSFDPTRRVPYHFGQLGLSDAQKESIYKIQAKHLPKVAALQKQLDELRGQMVKECESVLTDPQKQMLAERRANAAEPRTKQGGGAAAKPQG
jgi:hypothetical protein